MRNLLSKRSLFILTVVLLAIQFILSIARTGYYYTKIGDNDLSWVSMNVEERREEYYGSEYIFFNEIKNLPAGKYYLIADDGKAYFLGRYLLYPKKLFLLEELSRIKPSEYLLLFNEFAQLERILESGFVVVQEVYQEDNLIGIVLQKI